MTRHIVTAVCAAFALSMVIASPSSGQSVSREALRQLGPGGLWGPPASLEELVRISQAAVIAKIIGPGDLKFQEEVTPGGTRLGRSAYASYSVVIREVLYNRLADAAPPIKTGSRVELSQPVGRHEAEAFLDKRTPATPSDEYLLFLWHRPGAGEWSILQWPLQFRKSGRGDGLADTLASPAELSWLTPQWLGPSVPFVNSENGGVTPIWVPLVAEVHRVGAKQGQ
jgi:hypothetical protein